ncbi:diguanylate cyclase/phosphodiesterase [Granulicatella balaenopterae]|uniref:Diguanylate cyclase/phosphodiesterase n=1 Tax=Granulicatella balaenopterae TaxID=137733 RepID=A0A1H9KFH1_9LACT|nr:EAL domain-containing protein [Granulicatella balaenopterae]SEQ97871.1 diguanylate cyclase/phosphodiesterase [Granulicatella balaenopterae]
MSWSLSLLLFLLFAEVALFYVYKKTRKLPLIKNKLFGRIAVLVIVMSLYLVVDKIFYGPLVSWKYYSNLIKFSIFTVMVEYIYSVIILYIIYYLGFWKEFWKYRYVFRIPLYILLVICITTPWTGLIVSYTDGAFVRGSAYWTIYMVPAVFVVILIGFIVTHFDRVKLKQNWAVWLVVICATFGIVVNYFTYSIIVINFYFTVAEYLIYLKMCDPRLFRSHSTNTFNREAMLYMIDEYQQKGKQLYLGGIKLANYHNVLERIGIFRFDSSIDMVTEWIHSICPDIYVFYIDTKQIFLISEEPINQEKFLRVIKERFERSFIIDDHEIILQAEPFFVSYDLCHESMKQFIIYADHILEKCELDRQQLFVIDGEIINEMKQTNQLKRILTKKIKEKDLLVYYQPLFSTKSKRITGAEALVRMYDEKLGIILPYKFIPLAESTGEILDLGLVVFEKVCQYIQEHDLKEMGINFITVNVSPLQFEDTQLVHKFRQIARDYGVDLSMIEFEITESAMLNTALFDYQMKEFKKYNAHLVLDDFGMGSSNMQRLITYPFSTAKLDMSLVWSYFKGENHIMKHVIEIFKEQNLAIVAEGVEDQSMVKDLSEFGCEYLQGFYFSKPIPAEDFDRLVNQYNHN